MALINIMKCRNSIFMTMKNGIMGFSHIFNGIFIKLQLVVKECGSKIKHRQINTSM